MQKAEKITEHLQKIQNYALFLICSFIVTFFLAVFPNFRSLHAQTANLSLQYAHVDAAGFPVIHSSLTVRDGNSLLVGGLTENNFAVFEDGFLQYPITVEAFSSDSGGVSVVLIMDISGSMRQELPDAKNAAITLVNLLTDRDRGALISFDRRVYLEQAFTSDMGRLKEAINALKNGGGTSVYDATIEGVNLVKSQPGKKAIVLLTDGRDGNSKADLDDVTKLLDTAQIPVYAVGLGVNPNRGEPELRDIVRASGGIFYKAPSTNDLEDIYRKIAFVISRHQYRITYTTSNCATDGTMRLVKIEVKHNGMAASDTNSYQAPQVASRLTAIADQSPTPTQPFILKIVTPGSDGFTKSISEISFRIRYNTQYVNIHTPYDQNIVAGPGFGELSEHTLIFTVDDAAGFVNIEIKKNNASIGANSTGVLAEITFLADVALPDSTALAFQIDDVRAQNNGGCAMLFAPQAITLHSEGIVVWPGDTNFNGRVELSDVLILGQFWELKGPSRTGIENQLTWMPHVAKKYPIANATHADADGGGKISERDLIPIGLNWSKSVQDYVPGVQPKTSAALPEGQVFAKIEQADSPGRYLMRIELARDNSAPLAGFAFRMHYPGEHVSIGSVKSGELWQKQPLKFAKNSMVENLLAISLMLPVNSPFPENDGEVLQIMFNAAQHVSRNDITFDNIGLVGTDGRVNEIDIMNNFNVSDTKVPAVIELYPAYPNPFNPKTTLRFALPDRLNTTVYIFNIAGKLIRQFELGIKNEGQHQVSWDSKDVYNQAVSSGTYIVRLIATNNNGLSFTAEQTISLVK
ncbi:MAG: VWA domain-containing protein [bacterium]